jgi:hypothetical protein
MAALAGEPVFLDVLRGNAPALEIVQEAGFEVQRPFTRMVLGANDWPGHPSLVYATSGPEKG